jgi:hypothetical protein
MRKSALSVIVVLMVATSVESHAASLQEELAKNADRGAVVGVRVSYADPPEEFGKLRLVSDVPLYSADVDRQAVVVPAGAEFFCQYGERKLDRIAVSCGSLRLPSTETAPINGVVESHDGEGIDLSAGGPMIGQHFVVSLRRAGE